MNTNAAAVMLVKTLVEAGHVAYYAGGWVRDFILSNSSEDIDIATSAHPEEVMSLFGQTYSVGAAFGVVVVIIDGMQFEVATFRRDDCYVGGRKPESVTFTDPKEDALRRDFTINGMFYDPLTETIYDFVGGREDLKEEVIRAIGNPYERFEEDRLRMVRAVRFSVRFGFRIDEETKLAIKTHAETLLPAVSMERVWQELSRMVADGTFEKAISLLAELGLLQVIFPILREKTEKEIAELVSSIPNFPKECPPILFLMELFPDLNLTEQVGICRYLKATNKDCKLLEFVFSSRSLLQKGGKADPLEMVYFYSHQDYETSLGVLAAHLREKEREAFLVNHQEQIWKFGTHIKRRKEKDPLVNSTHLRKEGIVPGKEMGDLLKEAERIAITQDANDSSEVLKILKNSLQWPTSQ
jgi:poly(A) polymerase